ncbi:MAG: carboxy-S-adenosyl-L-methionine synthase CmoA [Candidatus Schekmanbacteria bacterium RBG_16_38_10]|uniref:Carboxy-S-adenosyl-L-methionine synthase n=1 Tax=Candidatus Schekmanbacteria bacterium RBG_16_38_10 TaxID=1817879 RepID=A0A1F7S369_9BACT|nr:MAG: carboxy-S-adenosyl-L-methionine synthase CmoA [Candidatus Schekmanbacteria bacterium RBG_16_38_10]
MVKKDKIFSKKAKRVSDFNFGKETAEVFDDMLDRSIPLYRELQKMIGEVASEFAVDGTNVYDLGCSTGITINNLYNAIDKDVKYIGVDYSQAMLDKCRERFEKIKFSKEYKLICADLNQGVSINNASVVVLNLTLQFVRPLYRDILIRDIYTGLNQQGCFIIVEKVLGNDSTFNRLFIKFYYDMKKKNGYSETEISQKREALENVLIPYRFDENKDLLIRNGFSSLDIFYKWYNFCGLIAIK